MDKSLNKESFTAEFIKELKKWAKSQKNVEMRFWE
jgi:NAD(P)H-dependent FMN reductase